MKCDNCDKEFINSNKVYVCRECKRYICEECIDDSLNVCTPCILINMFNSNLIFI